MATAATIRRQLAGGAVYLLPLADIPEAELLARACLTADERLRYDSFLPAQVQRRKEWLGARVLAAEELDGRIGYKPSGKPFLVPASSSAGKLHISVSHTTGWAALMVSCGGPCGVDIELADRSAERAAGRIASPGEIAAAAAVFPENPPLLVWCAKEAAYKAAGSPNADFRNDIRLERTAARTLIIDVKAESITLEIFAEGTLFGVGGSL